MVESLVGIDDTITLTLGDEGIEVSIGDPDKGCMFIVVPTVLEAVQQVIGLAIMAEWSSRLED